MSKPLISILQHQFHREDGGLPVRGIEEPARIIFCDPPYNLAIQYEDDPTGDDRTRLDYSLWAANVMCSLKHHLAPGGTLWWLCPPSHADDVGPLLTKMVGPRRYMVIKRESFAQYQQRQLTEDYRLLYCHVKPAGAATNIDDWGKDFLVENLDAIREPSKRQEMGDKRADPRGRVPGQVWDIRRLQGTSDDRVDWHPCQLAPELLRRVVSGWSNPGDHVIDAFAGSGNMGLVCRELGRNCTLIDQSSTYCRRMAERLGMEVEVPQ